jgi:hypothetical protein
MWIRGAYGSDTKCNALHEIQLGIRYIELESGYKVPQRHAGSESAMNRDRRKREFDSFRNEFRLQFDALAPRLVVPLSLRADGPSWPVLGLPLLLGLGLATPLSLVSPSLHLECCRYMLERDTMRVDYRNIKIYGSRRMAKLLEQNFFCF